MKEEMFDEFIESLKQGGAILRGEMQPSREFVFKTPAIDVKAIRAKHKMSQQEFAMMLGISVKTLRNWEQGRRKPEGAARVLLLVAAKHPEAIRDVVGR
jgi:putative transcriptional regulator